MLKYCAFFSLWAGLGLAQDYITYQAARLVVGQTNFTSQNAGTTNTLLGSANGIAFASNTLFVADGNRTGLTPENNRVLLFGNVTENMPQPLAAIPNYSGRCPVCVGQATLVLGQPNFTSADANLGATGMRTPTAVASDGQILVVADTLNNRILIWNTIPTVDGQPADLVLGQQDFNTVQTVVVNSSSFRAPQGVWVQNGKLYVADTQNNRVLIWNSIPTKNNQPADLVLGQPNFTTTSSPDQTQTNLVTAANMLLSPVSVTSDGVHLFVTDLGFNRVLIWNEIPTKNQQPADVEVGQPDMVSSVADNAFTGAAATSSTDTVNRETPVMCTVPNGTDPMNRPTYPNLCGGTLNFPRFALSDGQRLYIADGGNDRVLVYNTIPTQNATFADEILGQPDDISDVLTSATNPSSNPLAPNLSQSASNVIPSPTSLAWDGTNLYVADPTDYRVLVFTPAAPSVSATGVRNAASIQIYATDTIILSGAIQTGDTVTLTICPPVDGAVFSGTCSSTASDATNYVYTVQTTDTFDTVEQGLANLVNAGNGDPNVFAIPELGQQILLLVARAGGSAGNNVGVAVIASTGAQISAVASSATLTGGSTPTIVAPGTIISILGNNLSDTTAAASSTATSLPFSLGGVQVYVDGILTPLYYVSPTQINAQLPWELIDTTSSSLYVRTQHADGSVTVTDAVGIPIDLQDPGIFSQPGEQPAPGVIYHGSSYATGLIFVSGTIVAGNTATITIGPNSYTYTVLSTDTLATVQDGLIAAINSNPEEVVIATATGAGTNIFLQAKVPGPEGNNIAITGSSGVSATVTAGTSSSVTVTATTANLCCANVAGALVTADNPALAGEVLYTYATGLGLVGPAAATNALVDGGAYEGPVLNTPNAAVSAVAGTVTAQVISAGLEVGSIGIYKVVLQLGPDAPSNPAAQLNIAQNVYSSNIVSFPLINPIPPNAATSTTSTTVATPTFDPGTGSYGMAQSVVISTTTASAIICYRTDGKSPTATTAGTCDSTSTTYTTPINVAASVTITAIGTLAGSTNSSVGSATYTIQTPTIAHRSLRNKIFH